MQQTIIPATDYTAGKLYGNCGVLIISKLYTNVIKPPASQVLQPYCGSLSAALFVRT